MAACSSSGGSRIASIVVTSPSSSIAVSGTVSFTASAKDSNGNVISGITFTWASSSPTVATIDSASGTGTALLPGSTQITASANGLTSGPFTLAVTPGFLLTGALNTPRVGGTATLLNNGMVLIAGGNTTVLASDSTTSAELYNPTTGTFTPTGSMNVGHNLHTATLLNNGMVLIAGGITANDAAIATAELYNPATGQFSLTGNMNTPRYLHSATLLPSGKVLMASGVGTNTAELYDPAAGSFTTTGNLGVEREAFAAVLLNEGKVLVAGGLGTSGYLATAELYDPSIGTFAPTGSMASPRDLFTAILLNDGRVLLAGGVSNAQTSSGAELYDPATGLFTSTGGLVNGRFRYSACLLTNGSVLMAGGDMSSTAIGSSSELYDPASQTFSLTGSLNFPRDSQIATLLDNGNVLVAAGVDSGGSKHGEELYEPAPLTPPGLQSISVNPVLSALSPGATQRFVAMGTFPGSTQQLAAVIWTSSNPSLVQITNDGTNRGTAFVLTSPPSSTSVTITATAGNISGTSSIVVNP